MSSRTAIRTFSSASRAVVGTQSAGRNAAVKALPALAARSPAAPQIIAPRVARSFHASPLQALEQNASKNAKGSDWTKKGNIKYEELKPITESPSGNITIIDVREPSETAQGMIPSAVNVPLSEFTTAFKTGSGGGDFSKKYAFSRPGYDDQLVFYCRSGKRSAQAIEEAKKGGWWNVRNYEGSWLDWTAQEQSRGQNDD